MDNCTLTNIINSAIAILGYFEVRANSVEQTDNGFTIHYRYGAEDCVLNLDREGYIRRGV